MSDYWYTHSPADVPHPGTMPSPTSSGPPPPPDPRDRSLGAVPTVKKKKKGAATIAAPTAAAPTGGADSAPPYPGYLTPEEQLAQAQAQAKAMIQPYLDVLNAQQARQTQAHQLQQAGLAKLYDVLGGSMVGVGGQIADIYSQGAANLGQGFQTGYSHGWQIAQQGLQGQGQGFQQSAEALPAIAGQTGGVKFLQAVQQGNEEDAKLQDLISTTAAQLPEKTQAYLADIQQQQAQQQTAYQTYQSRQATLAMQAGKTDAAQAWKVADTWTKGTNTVYIAVQNPDGSWKVQPSGPKTQKPTVPKAPTTFTGPDGATWAWSSDGKGGWTAKPITGPKPGVDKPPTRVPTPGGGSAVWVHNKDGSWSLKQVVEGTPPTTKQPTNTGPWYLDPNDNTWKLKAGFKQNPDGSVASTKTNQKYKFTAKQRENAWKEINASTKPVAYTNAVGQALSPTQLQATVSAFNKAHANQTRKVHGKTVSFKDQPLTVADLSIMKPEALTALGLVPGKRMSAQEVYLDIIHKYGIPARTAYQWVKKAYPNFDPNNTYFPTPTTATTAALPPPGR